jgi:hypothetical protein
MPDTADPTEAQLKEHIAIGVFVGGPPRHQDPTGVRDHPGSADASVPEDTRPVVGYRHVAVNDSGGSRAGRSGRTSSDEVALHRPDVPRIF